MFKITAQALATEHKADAFSVNVKSNDLAIVTLEFVNEWAIQFAVDGFGNNTRIW